MTPSATRFPTQSPETVPGRLHVVLERAGWRSPSVSDEQWDECQQCPIEAVQFSMAKLLWSQPFRIGDSHQQEEPCL